MPQAGIEPTTLALGVLCSVHLSYWGGAPLHVVGGARGNYTKFLRFLLTVAILWYSKGILFLFEIRLGNMEVRKE